jgi:hypothetical protein
MDFEKSVSASGCIGAALTMPATLATAIEPMDSLLVDMPKCSACDVRFASHVVLIDRRSLITCFGLGSATAAQWLVLVPSQLRDETLVSFPPETRAVVDLSKDKNGRSSSLKRIGLAKHSINSKMECGHFAVPTLMGEVD